MRDGERKGSKCSTRKQISRTHSLILVLLIPVLWMHCLASFVPPVLAVARSEMHDDALDYDRMVLCERLRSRKMKYRLMEKTQKAVKRQLNQLMDQGLRVQISQ
jgi:hypothetical protein